MSIVLDGTSGITAPNATVSGTVQGSPVRGGLVSGTAVTASGTSVDFTGIPSWVKRITVMLSGVSTNGTSPVQIQLGDSGGVETTGYLGSATRLGASTLVTNNYTAGFTILTDAAVLALQGALTIANVSENAWVCSGVLGASGGISAFVTGSSKTLSDTLTQVRITTVNGTDTFDAGTINIIYEG